MNFLQICQRTSRESGTVGGDSSPTTVVSQAGRLLRIVDCVQAAYDRIQLRNDWLWMRREFSGPSIANTPRYTGASFSLTRMRRWITEPDTVTCYLTATGVSDEAPLSFIPWAIYRAMYERGTQTALRPSYFSVSPQREFCLGPRPDAVYTIRGEYWQSLQSLTANSDTPDMPDDHHMIIVWDAIILLSQFDDVEPVVLQTAFSRYAKALESLEAEQLPELIIGSRPLA